MNQKHAVKACKSDESTMEIVAYVGIPLSLGKIQSMALSAAGSGFARRAEIGSKISDYMETCIVCFVLVHEEELCSCMNKKVKKSPAYNFRAW